MHSDAATHLDTANSQRVLVIGLDGGTFALLDPLIGQGLMPHLKALLEGSSYGPLESTVPPLTSPAWTSFVTGKNPGKHGILLFTSPDVASGEPILANSQLIDGPTLWDLAGDGGKQVVTINVPMTYPARPVNGIMITGMMTPLHAAFTYPADLVDRYPGLGDYVIDVNSAGRQHDVNIDDLFIASPRAYIDQVDEMRARRTAVALEMLRRESWQLFTLVYTGLDRLCHMMWQDLYALATGRSKVPVRYGQRLVDYIRNLDQDLGKFFDAVGEDTHIVLMSDHGFGPRASRRFYLNAWLQQAGLLAVQGEGRVQSQAGYWLTRLKDGRWSKITRWLARALPTRLRGKLRRQANQNQRALIDREKTRAQAVMMAGSVAGIQLADDLSRSDKEAIVDGLQRDLLAVVDPQSGERIVREIIPSRDVYSGPHVDEFPELILIANEQYEVVNTLVDRGYAAPMVMQARTGDHRPDGIFVLHGKHARTGQLRERWWIPDVSATILYLLGVPLPDDLDGRVVSEAIERRFLEQNPVQTVPAGKVAQRRSTLDTEQQDQEAVMARLRGLGYIE